MINMVSASDLVDSERFAEGDFVFLALVELGLKAKFESILLELKVLCCSVEP